MLICTRNSITATNDQSLVLEIDKSTEWYMNLRTPMLTEQTHLYVHAKVRYPCVRTTLSTPFFHAMQCQKKCSCLRKGKLQDGIISY